MLFALLRLDLWQLRELGRYGREGGRLGLGMVGLVLLYGLVERRLVIHRLLTQWLLGDRLLVQRRLVYLPRVDGLLV